MAGQRHYLPVSYFGIAVGWLALANAWRVATRLWSLPQEIAHAVTALALLVWLVVVIAYAVRWWTDRAQARAELEHPLHSSFTALASVASLLAANALRPYAPSLALGLVSIALVVQLLLGVQLQAQLWRGGRKPELVTSAIYLPSVAQNFVAGTACATFGWPQLGALFFGAGFLSWLALESMVLLRATVQEPLPEPVRPLLGVQLAPPVVGGVTYLSLTHGVPDLFAMGLFGYGAYQGLLLLRLLPWIQAQPFVPSYWAFSFGVSALPTMAMLMVERGADGPLPEIAVVSFVFANLVIAGFVIKTFGLVIEGRFLPVSTPA